MDYTPTNHVDTMHSVVISLASNRFQKQNLLKARECLGQVLFSLIFSDELWTKPIGSKRTDMYLNQLAIGTTTLPLDQLNSKLKAIETDFGRNESKRVLNIVPIDLDVMSFDGVRYHLRDWDRPYMQLFNEFLSVHQVIEH